MTTQAEALNWLNGQVGQHLDYDHQFGQQCFDFFNFFYQLITGQGPYGAGYQLPFARQIWDVPNDNFIKIPDSSNLVPQPGDVAVYGSAWGAGAGHVEICVGTDSTGCTFIGENEHNNNAEGVVKVHRTWAQMRGLIGVLRPKWAQPPAPAPTPTPAPSARYTVTETYPGGRQIVLHNKHSDTVYLWGMNYDFDFMRNHPVETHKNGEIWAVTNKVHHQDGSDYYRRDGQIDGFNVVDCDDYVAPAPAPAPTPTPAPNPTPAPPITVPTSTELYPIKTTVPTYGSKTDAQNHANQKGEILFGSTWYVYCEKEGMLNITQTPGTTSGTWIDPTTNASTPPAPAPTPTPAPNPTPAPKVETEADIRSSFLPMMPDSSPVECEALDNVLVVDTLGYGNPITAAKGNLLKVHGTFLAAGHVFALVKIKNPQTRDNYMYGVNISARDNFKPFLSDPYTLNDHIRKNWELIYDKAFQTIDGIFRALRKKK